MVIPNIDKSDTNMPGTHYPHSQVDVSIIIVNWNTCEILEQALKSIYEFNDLNKQNNYNFEIIVIDNNSSDNSIPMLEEKFDFVKIIQNKKNLGFAKANNQGIRIAKGKYILLLNSDVVILDNAIYKIKQFADNNIKAGVIGCCILNKDKSYQYSCRTYPGVLNIFLWGTGISRLFPKNRICGRQDYTWWEGNSTNKVEALKGCFLFIRNELIKMIGDLDENFYFYGEDLDFCLRTANAGYDVVYTPIAQIIHLDGSSSNKIWFSLKLRLYRSHLQFIKKHKSRIYFFIATILMSIFLLIRLPIWFLRFIKEEKYYDN